MILRFPQLELLVDKEWREQCKAHHLPDDCPIPPMCGIIQPIAGRVVIELREIGTDEFVGQMELTCRQGEILNLPGLSDFSFGPESGNAADAGSMGG